MNIIDNAKQLLEGHWGKGAFYRNGNYCIIGAMSSAAVNMSALGSEEYVRAVRLLREVMSEQYPEFSKGTIQQFNDHQNTTEADVLRVMKEASVRLDGRI